MEDQESLKRLRTVGFSVDHVHDLLAELFTLGVATGPTVTGSSSFFGDEDILRVIKIRIGARLYSVYNLRVNKKILLVRDRLGLTWARSDRRQLGRRRRPFCLLLECWMCTILEYLIG